MKMTVDSAWENFKKSGSIADYLMYKKVESEEAEETENQSYGTCNQGYGD